MRYLLCICATIILFCQNVSSKNVNPPEHKPLQCFYCLDKCGEKLAVDTCPLNTKEFSYLCISSFTIIADKTVEQKGCIAENDIETKETCLELDNLAESSCRLCKTDFCNYAFRNQGTFIFTLIFSVLAKKLL